MFIDVNDATLYYETRGSGRPFILLHGNGENHEIFDKLSIKLSAYYKIYAVDTRGHGRSSSLSFADYESMAFDVIALIDALHLDSPNLLGFSDGGIIGLLVAMERPHILHQLIVCGANLYPDGIKTRSLRRFRIIRRFTHSPLVAMMLTQPNIRPDALHAIAVPTLVLAGQRDLIREDHTRQIAANIPGSQLKILPGESHSSYIVHTDRVFPVIAPFLQLAA